MHFKITPSHLALSLLLVPATTASSSSSSSSKCKPKPIKADVVVIGAGFSGMTAAYELNRAGLDTVVLEARDRVGGRSHSIKRKSGEGIIEMGAAWINNVTQPNVFAFTQEFGLETNPQYTDGDIVYQDYEDRSIRLPGDNGVNTDDPELGEAVGELLFALDAATNETDIEDWGSFPEEQDVTLEEWLEAQGLWEHPHLRAVTDGLSSIIVGQNAADVGAHFFFDYVASGGGLLDLSTEGKAGAQSRLVKEGTSAIVDAMAETLPSGNIHLNSAVKSIKQTCDNHVKIATTKDGKTFKAKKVIITIPTNTYSDIEFSPALPEDKETIVSGTQTTAYAKVVLGYSKAWWKEAGLVGKFQSANGPIAFTWDTSDDDLEQFSLTVLVAGRNGAAWFELPKEEREKAVVENLAEMVGGEIGLGDEARDTLEINSAMWSEAEFIWTGPTSTMGPGLLRQFGPAFRESFGGLHFAGTEMAYKWKGYLEGAITAGQTAAEEVIEALGK